MVALSRLSWKYWVAIVIVSLTAGILATNTLAASSPTAARRLVAVTLLANNQTRSKCQGDQMQGVEFSKIQAYNCKYPVAVCLPVGSAYFCRGRYELWATIVGRTGPVPYRDQSCRGFWAYRYGRNGQLQNRNPDHHWGCKTMKRGNA